MKGAKPKYRVANRASARCKTSAGFTLIEILVAMSIFAVAVLGLAVGATSVMRANQTSYFNTIATNIAQDKLEELKGMTVAALPSCPSYTTAGCSDTKTSLGLTFSRSWQIIANSPTSGVNRLDVKVDWTDYRSHSLTFSSAVKQ
ncbi:MAG: prepilin-type N-terminal cleavage/methylation domain-containing protein [Deltaproteobacteria bacterium]|nr:prepilin-type N-terminal cleavage/methylation domain-containing protein [Deltaproteobacteria bacterium]